MRTMASAQLRGRPAHRPRPATRRAVASRPDPPPWLPAIAALEIPAALLARLAVSPMLVGQVHFFVETLADELLEEPERSPAMCQLAHQRLAAADGNVCFRE